MRTHFNFLFSAPKNTKKKEFKTKINKQWLEIQFYILLLLILLLLHVWFRVFLFFSVSLVTLIHTTNKFHSTPLSFPASATLRPLSGRLTCVISEVCELFLDDPFHNFVDLIRFSFAFSWFWGPKCWWVFAKILPFSVSFWRTGIICTSKK